MVWGDRLRRWGRDQNIWLYLMLVILALNTALSFTFQDDVQGVANLLMTAFYILMVVLSRVGNPVPNRTLNALMFTSLACFILITFGSDNRRLAPALSRALPHVKMDVTQMWTITRRDESALQGGHIQVFNVTLQSHRARGVEVDSYDFELEAGGTRYRAALDDMTGSCDAQQLPLGGALSCRVAFAVPKNAGGSTLVFDGRNYTAWTDVAF